MTKQQGQNHFRFYCHALSIELPMWLSGKESVCSAGDLGSILVLGRSLGEGKGYPLQYPSLENSMDRRACQAIEHGVSKSQA